MSWHVDPFNDAESRQQYNRVGASSEYPEDLISMLENGRSIVDTKARSVEWYTSDVKFRQIHQAWVYPEQQRMHVAGVMISRSNLQDFPKIAPVFNRVIAMSLKLLV